MGTVITFIVLIGVFLIIGRFVVDNDPWWDAEEVEKGREHYKV